MERSSLIIKITFEPNAPDRGDTYNIIHMLSEKVNEIPIFMTIIQVYCLLSK